MPRPRFLPIAVVALVSGLVVLLPIRTAVSGSFSPEAPVGLTAAEWRIVNTLPSRPPSAGSQSEGLGGGLVIEVENGTLDVTRFDPGASDFHTGPPTGPPNGVVANGVPVADDPPTRERDPGDDQGDDPRDAPSEDGEDPRDEDLPAEVCGPDVTAAYLEALLRAHERLSELDDDERGAWDGAHFLNRNGGNIDMVARAVMQAGKEGGGVEGRLCPRGERCRRTVTLAGHCVSAHVANDIMYGFVVEMLDVPWSIALGGAHAWDVLQYGGLDPNTSKAAYTMGSTLAKWMNEGRPLSSPAFKRIMETTRIVEGGFFGAKLVSLLDLVARDEAHVKACAPCPDGCISDLTKDFSTMKWSLSDGRSAEYAGGEPAAAPASEEVAARDPAPTAAPSSGASKDCGTAAARFGMCDPRPAGNQLAASPPTIDAAADPAALGGPSGGGQGDGDARVVIVIEGKGRASGEGVFDVHVLLNQSKTGEAVRIVLPPGTRVEPIEDPSSETLERAREIISRVKGGDTRSSRIDLPDRGRPTFFQPVGWARWPSVVVRGTTVSLPGYCLDRELAPPAQGMLYRLAQPDDQEATAVWLTSLLAASMQLRDEGALRPDSDPNDYYHSIRQWAIWVYAERMNESEFADTFLEHVRQNFDAAGQPWTEETSEAVRGFVPNRWADIRGIIERAEAI